MTRHGRSGGGSFGPPPPSQHHHPPPPSFHPPPPSFHPPPPSFHPPPPHYRRPPPPIFYGPPPVVYSSGPFVGGAGYQMPPQAVTRQVDSRTARLNRSKAIFTFFMLALIVGTVWLYFGPYGSDIIEVGVHDSRLITARPFFVKDVKFKNRYDTDGPRFYVFDHKPPLNQESRWVDSQQDTFSNYHKEYYYWMNKGSIVTIHSTLEVTKKLESVFLAMVRATPEDLQAYYDKPNVIAKPLHDHDVSNFEVKEDADYAFSLITFNPANVTVYLDMSFRTREYTTVGSIQQSNLKSAAKMGLSFFRSRYGLLQGPGSGETGVDVWDIEVSYGTRWTTIIFIYGLVTLVYLVTKSMIMASIHDIDPSLPEYAPLVQPQETQSTVAAPAPAAPAAPSAPVLPASVAEEDSKLKEGGKDSEKEIPEDKLCSVCLDAPKDSFFVPCGHRATCFSCGLRLSQFDPPNCPICRQPITEVKKIYDA